MRLLFVLAGFCLTLSFSTAQAQMAAGTEARPLVGSRTRFLLSDIDAKLVKEFNGAWQQCMLGTRNIEAVVMVLRQPDGSIKALSAGNSTQSYEFTFVWNPAIIAVFHTHPNNSAAKPVAQDILVARRFDVPILTLTSRGMFMYDPATDRITRVKAGIDWLDHSSWQHPADLAAVNSSRK